MEGGTLELVRDRLEVLVGIRLAAGLEWAEEEEYDRLCAGERSLLAATCSRRVSAADYAVFIGQYHIVSRGP